jgi:RNA polymerase sigma factor (sigma-70 family)
MMRTGRAGGSGLTDGSAGAGQGDFAAPTTTADDLTSFVAAYLPRLRAALLAWAGEDAVDEAVAETLLHLSRQPERVLGMANPRGYLYRVARSKLRGSRRKVPVLPPVPAAHLPEIEPGLPAALASLPERQRVALFLMAGLGWTAREVGEVLGIAPTSVHNHYQRGLARLRETIGEVEP